METDSIRFRHSQLILIPFFIYSLLLLSCHKKEENIDPIPACKVISFSNEHSYRLQVSYTADNQIEKYFQTEIPYLTATVEYGANGKVAKLKYSMPSGALNEHHFEYTPKGLISKLTLFYINLTDPILIEQRTFEYQAGQQVPYKINYFIGNASYANQVRLTGYMTLDYTAEGNVAKTIHYDSDGTWVVYEEYEYDTKPNPFKPFVYVHPYGSGDLDEILAFSKNNPVKRTLRDRFSEEIITSLTYGYEYNDRGYPVKADLNTSKTHFITYYLEYDCK